MSICRGESVVAGWLVWCLRNNYTFVALKLAWGEARGRECIPSDTRPTEQRSPRPISAQPEGRHVFWAKALLLAPYRSTSGYARRSRLASAQNPLPRMYSYFGDTTLAARESLGARRRIRSQAALIILFCKNLSFRLPQNGYRSIPVSLSVIQRPPSRCLTFY